MKQCPVLICGILSLVISPSLAADPAGITAKITPEQAKPGDLVTLRVQMSRENYGEFDLEVPPHPRLHLVSREKIPPTFSGDQYLQSERLLLQPLSSGPLTLTGIRAHLTEATGNRTVELPALSLNVLPFDSEDEKKAPEPLPDPDAKLEASSYLFLILAAILILGLPLILLIRKKLTRDRTAETASSPFDEILSSLANEPIPATTLETLLNEHGDALSSKLRADLETWLYSPERFVGEINDLPTRLRKELGT